MKSTIFSHLLIVSGLVLLTTSANALVEENACVNNVEAQFQNLNAGGHRLAIRTAGQVPGRAFTQAPLAMFGYQNHFQGIQRLHDKPYVILTGGNWWAKKGYLFVLKLGTKEGSGEAPFGSNVTKMIPPQADRMVKRIDIGDKVHWHPGGLGSSGDIVAVTAEEFIKQEAGKIFFYDFSDPENPKIFPNATIDRGKGKAGSVDLFKANDGHFIVLTYTGGVVYFYRSRTTSISDGFDVATEMPVAHDGGSSVNIVKQCDGQLYLLAYDNSAHIAPIQKGIDQVFLTKLNFTADVGSLQELKDPKAEKVSNGTKDLSCSGYCNFASAAGSFVSNEGKLSIYSSNFYRNYWGTKLKFKEFPQK